MNVFMLRKNLCLATFSIISQTKINLIIHIFLIYDFIILGFFEIYQSIHVFLINYVDLFRNLNFLDFFPFFDLILIDLNMVLLRAWKMIWSLWKFGLINIILRKLLIKILVSVERHWTAWTKWFLLFLNLSVLLNYNLFAYFLFELSLHYYISFVFI